MCAVQCPPHLLFLHEPLADDLVDGGFDKSARNRLAVPVTIRVIRDRRYVDLTWDIGTESPRAAALQEKLEEFMNYITPVVDPIKLRRSRQPIDLKSQEASTSP